MSVDKHTGNSRTETNDKNENGSQSTARNKGGVLKKVQRRIRLVFKCVLMIPLLLLSWCVDSYACLQLFFFTSLLFHFHFNVKWMLPSSPALLFHALLLIVGLICSCLAFVLFDFILSIVTPKLETRLPFPLYRITTCVIFFFVDISTILIFIQFSLVCLFSFRVTVVSGVHQVCVVLSLHRWEECTDRDPQVSQVSEQRRGRVYTGDRLPWGHGGSRHGDRGRGRRGRGMAGGKGWEEGRMKRERAE